MTNKEDILGTEHIGKLLLEYSIPAIIGMVVNSLYFIIARIFIANIPGVGALAITGVGVTMPVTTIISAFAVLVGSGASTNIAIKLGQRKKDEAERIIGNAMTLSFLIGIILTIIGFAFADGILGAFGASTDTLPIAKEYIHVLLIGTVFNVSSIVLTNMIRVDGNPKLSATIMVTGCITNILLCYTFIFLFQFGIRGASLAAVISQIITATWGFSYFIRGKSNLKFDFKNLRLIKAAALSILEIGSAPFAIQLAASIVQIVNNNSLKLYGGDLAIGAMATINAIMIFFMMPILGITQGAQPIVGFNYGCRQLDRAKKTFQLSLIASTVILTLGWCMIEFAPEIIVGFFGKDEQLMQITINGLRKYGMMLPIISISLVGSNYIQAVGKPRKAMILSLLRQVILLIPLIIVLPKFLQLNGIWIAQAAADFAAVLITGFALIMEFKSYKNEPAVNNKAILARN